ncbi:MAG: hypothetical protein IT439_02040 [Phycisphaerales bacterium]|nr:hypothetical protein [Phycisphaerales bacterium]
MFKKAMAFFGCVGIAAGIASADTVNLRFDGTGAGRSVNITFGEDQMNVFAGQLRHTFTGGTGIMEGHDGAQITFCTDLTQRVDRHGTLYRVEDLTNMPDAPNIDPMSSDQAQLLKRLYAYADGDQSSVEVGNAYAAAFQLMVWEIVWDFAPGELTSDLSLAVGDFTARKTDGNTLDNDVLDAFADLRDGIAHVGGLQNLVGLASECAQDQLFVVPTPGTGMLAAMSLLLAAPRSRRTAPGA